MAGQCNLLGIVQEIEILPFDQMVYENAKSVLENEMNKLLWDFDIRADPLISERQPDLIIVNKKKKRNYRIVDFAIPVDQRLNLKECKEKY